MGQSSTYSWFDPTKKIKGQINREVDKPAVIRAKNFSEIENKQKNLREEGEYFIFPNGKYGWPVDAAICN